MGLLSLIILLVVPEIDFIYTHGVFKGDDGLKLRVFVEMEASDFTLIREDGGFVVSYSISLILTRDKKERGDVWMKRIEGLEYETERVILDTVSINVQPGSYEMMIIVSDLNSSKGKKEEKEVFIDSLPDFSISDIIITKDSMLIDYGVLPGDEICSYFEVYSDRDASLYFTFGDSVDTTYIGPGRTPIRKGSILQEAKDVVISAILEGGGEKFVRLDTLSPGVSIFMDDRIYKDMVMALRYIMTTEDIDTLLLVKPGERARAWGEFWRLHDPTPGTDRNELKEEYTSRVEYANEELGGWNTDMGMVFIVMGRPDEIERHPFDIESWAYEIWYYYSTNEKFIFYDTHGLGFYQLVYPEDWNPLKARKN